MDRSDSSPRTTRSPNKRVFSITHVCSVDQVCWLFVHTHYYLSCRERGCSLHAMQNLNIERSISLIETKLKDRHCLKDLVILAKEHPESINRFISLAEAIEDDLNSRGLGVWSCFICRWIYSCHRSTRELYL